MGMKGGKKEVFSASTEQEASQRILNSQTWQASESSGSKVRDAGDVSSGLVQAPSWYSWTSLVGQQDDIA